MNDMKDDDEQPYPPGIFMAKYGYVDEELGMVCATIVGSANQRQMVLLVISMRLTKVLL